jgi:regulator of RNase E activity RraA
VRDKEDEMVGEEKLGLRVFTKVSRVPREKFEKLMKVTTGNVCDAMDRFGAMDYQIKPVDPLMKCVGTAITVKARPCDNLIVYKALEIAQPGDIIVIGIYNYTTSSTWGDLTSLIGKQKGLAGMVTDGLVRDVFGIKEVGLPVFSRGSIPTSPFKDGPGEVNVPIACGGISVRPGDVLFGDVDGVVVIPQENVDQVVRRAVEIAAEEEKKVKDIKSGHLIPDWVAKILRERGYVID